MDGRYCSYLRSKPEFVEGPNDWPLDPGRILSYTELDFHEVHIQKYVLFD